VVDAIELELNVWQACRAVEERKAVRCEWGMGRVVSVERGLKVDDDVQRELAVERSRALDARGGARWWSWWSPLASRLDLWMRLCTLSCCRKVEGPWVRRDHRAKRAQETASDKPWGQTGYVAG
jgi:hypothetical protein